MARRGSKVKIDVDQLEKLSSLQCTDEEIAAWFGVSTRTIERRRKVKRFADVMERGRAKGRISLRRAQMKILERGNATMGVWLGKQFLRQWDAPQVTVPEFSLPVLLGLPKIKELEPDWPPLPETKAMVVNAGERRLPEGADGRMQTVGELKLPRFEASEK